MGQAHALVEDAQPVLAADDLGDLAADDCCAVAPYKVHQLVVDLDLEELQTVIVLDRVL